MKLTLFSLVSLFAVMVNANTAVAADANNNLRAEAVAEGDTSHRNLASTTGVIGSTDGTLYLELVDHDGWVHTTSDLSEATRFETYVWKGKTYYKPTVGKWAGAYLSYNKNDYMGVYRTWRDARAWAPRNGCLTVHGLTWETFEYSNEFAMVGDTVERGYESMCLEFQTGP